MQFSCISFEKRDWKPLDLNDAGYVLEWYDIKQDLNALQEVTIEENGKSFAIRSECKGHCSKIFKAVKVAFPPSIRESVIVI